MRCSVTEWSEGIRNRYFYFDSSTLSTNWNTPFYDAVNKWYNTDTYHAFSETANWNNSQMDFIVEYDPWGGHGETVFYFSSVQGYVYPYNQDWKYCEVFLNDYNIDETTISGRAAGGGNCGSRDRTHNWSQ